MSADRLLYKIKIVRGEREITGEHVQPPCAPASRELAFVELNKKAATDKTKTTITNRYFMVHSPLRLFVQTSRNTGF